MLRRQRKEGAKRENMFVKKCRLFDGISENQAMDILKTCGARSVNFRKGDVILHEGEFVSDIGIVESGFLEGVRYLVDGSRDVAAVFSEGDVFGDVLAVSGSRGAPITVLSRCDSTVAFVPFKRLFDNAEENDSRVLYNLMKCISDKYFDLNFRLMCIACPTLRKKLLFYLGTVGGHSREPFNIPLDRAALADFLCTDRSALSRELSKMKRDGLLDFYKNTFRLFHSDEYNY